MTPKGLLKPRSIRAALATLTVALASGGIVVFGVDSGHSAQNVRLLSGAAWLASPKVGQISLLDGSSAEVAAQVQVAPAGDAIEVVQSGSNGYVVDQTMGTVRRIDGASFEAGGPESPIPAARGGLVAFPGRDSVYLLDSRRGVLAAADPKTLTRRGDQVPLAARLAAGAAALDDADRLWTIDNDTGVLTRVSGTSRTTQRDVTRPGRSILAIANGSPVVVDTTERKAITIDADSGKVSTRIDLDLRPDEEIQVSGSAHTPRLYVVAARGALTICDLAEANCDSAVPLEENARLGAAVEAANRLFIPDFNSGQVWIIDLSSRAVVAKTKVLANPGQFHLLTRDGVVFFNDPNTERAGVIRLDGTVTPVNKYDPADPKKGLTTPSTEDNRPEQPNQPEQPQQPDPNQPPGPNQPKPEDPNNPAPPTPNPNPNPNPPPPTPGPNPAPPQPNPDPNPNPPPPNPPPPKLTLKITVSKSKPEVNEDISLRVSDTNDVVAASAQWDFGDGSQGSGPTVTHRWATAKTYQVSVQATMPDGQQGTTSLGVEVTPPATVTVPNVVGQTEANAKAAITNAGLVPNVTKVFNNGVPAGAVISQSPQGGASAAPQSRVDLTVSSGPHTPFDLIGLAPQAAWRSGAGALGFNGSDTDQTGFALHRNGPYDFGQGPCVLEDGSSTPTYLETHPQWVDNGFIDGVYTLPAPIIAGDRLRGRIGFIECRDLQEAGDATFTVSVIMPNGGEVQVFRRQDTTSNGQMPTIDVDLTAHAGATKVRLRVDANGTSLQDWASWIGLKIGE